ncbi:MAG: prenyltransferase [Halobacteria archaeon]|nr:prenyltransferase [Halobacteria archaeon]
MGLESGNVFDGLRYLLRLSRPRFWLYLAGPAVLGAVLGGNSVDDLLSPTPAFLVLYFLIPANVMLYGVNDYFDRGIDEENPKKEAKESVYRRSRWVDAVVGVSLLVTVGLTVALGSPVMAAFVFLSVGYSAPPLRFKTKPFLDSLSNGLYILPFVVSHVAVAGEYPPALTVAGGWLWTMAMHTFSAIPDIQPDRRAGIRTTATFLGRRRTYVYCTAVWLLSAVTVGVWNSRLGGVILVYPVLSTAFYVSNLTDSEAYWYYPYINSLVGMVLTLAGLLRLPDV